MSVQTTGLQKKHIGVNSYGNKQKNGSPKIFPPGGMIDAHDLHAAGATINGNPIDVNQIYYWTKIKDSIPDEIKNRAYLLGALREFSEETGLIIPSEYHSKIVNSGNNFHLQLSNEEYENLVKPLVDKRSNMPQPEISGIYFQKYLKYKNKYIKLKKQLE